MMKILCHGGAGPRGKQFDKKNAVVRRAAELGMAILQNGGAAVEAVEAAVTEMEDNPLLNAGTGSYVQMDGMVRMDASIMDNEMKIGSVIGIHDVKNPIQVANRLKEIDIHSVLGADLATQFARSEGFDPYDPRTIDKLEIWLDMRKRFLHMSSLEIARYIRGEIDRETSLGTVGCVALDEKDRLAAGTSTGGLMVDMPGRVGDVPLIGCGTYANRHAAISCTGVGEKIIQVCLAKAVADYVRQGQSPMDASRMALDEVEAVSGRAGLICLDAQGRSGHRFNTESMTFYELVTE